MKRSEEIKSKKKNEIIADTTDAGKEEVSGYFGAPDSVPLTSESAKEQLERSIELKLMRMRGSEYDFPESFYREKERKETLSEPVVEKEQEKTGDIPSEKPETEVIAVEETDTEVKATEYKEEFDDKRESE